MSNIYGSPFPKINPNIRYRTTLERAGFDVNFQAGKNGHKSGTSITLKSEHSNVTPASANSNASVRSPPYMNHNKSNNNVQEQLFNFENPNNKSNVSIGSQRHNQNNNASFRLQKNNHSNLSVNSQRHNQSDLSLGSHGKNNAASQELNPVEKSFMMLTENDTTTSFHTAVEQDFYTPQPQLNPYTQKTTAYNQNNNHDSLNLNANPELERNLTNHSEDLKPVISRTTKSLKSHFDEESYSSKNSSAASNFNPILNEHNGNVPSGNNPRRSVAESFISEDLNLGLNEKVKIPNNASVYSQRTHQSSNSNMRSNKSADTLNFSNSPVSERQWKGNTLDDEDSSTPVLATNQEVEKLLEQLNNSSLSRENNLDLDLQNKSLSYDALQNVDYPRKDTIDPFLNLNNSDTRFKKSSAYLSGYQPKLHEFQTFEYETEELPKLNSNTLPETVNEEPVENTLPATTSIEKGFQDYDKQNSVEDLNKVATDPLHFNAGSTINFADTIATTTVTDTLAAAAAAATSTTSTTNDKQNIDTPTIDNFEINSQAQKIYPPGEGPCRKCGLEIIGKRIYSKHNNELSGQWHRDCFQCALCDITFNKTTPCYIIDDRPYCQQHYHETNNSICQICNKFIEGECLENDKQERFHTDCLTCFICRSSMKEVYYIFNGEVPICGNHDIDTLLRDGLGGNADQSSSNNGNGHHPNRNNTLMKRRTKLINFA
ncbi:hypothetical protein TPHA_0E00300 [Tetrapisispora phaffii CBS 4417]|uniref:LIM zinc-binding domain-containing protein n=1 Tax=Tetrapisispora phaffii (strain ATCC 24235 / CBS 4417 / NBRC 1672 / NRRL Y-8282 / UCD 70-5) TaxID=1071381 RepID=G8BT98_TETPH|nr:hypothetical protein TPHA_0E00300 [Tetrapisispora phaffii CBS 4417]CCE63126.1 hypothetical protein TPHA_0E00300 [Tetrapisispora phaffii CBS 4417]